MIAPDIEKRNLALSRMLACLALAEICLGIILGTGYSLGCSSLRIAIAAFGLIMVPGTILHYARACGHFANAKSYGNGWAVLALGLAFASFFYLLQFALSLRMLPQIWFGLAQAYPLLCFGIGALPIVLLPDRSQRSMPMNHDRSRVHP